MRSGRRIGVAEEGAGNGEGRERAGGGGLVAGEVVKGEGVNALGGGGVVGVDLEVGEVGDDEERRVAEGLAVVVELPVGALEIAVVALVFPGKVVAHPDVGESLPALDFSMCFSKAYRSPVESVAAGVGWPSMSQRLRKWGWAPERSEPV